MWRYRCWHRAFSLTHFCPRMSPMWITRWEKRSNTRLSWASRLRSLWLTTSHPVWSRWRSYDPFCWRPLLTPAVCGWKTRSVWMFSIDSVLIHSGPQSFVFASSLQKHTQTEETWKSWLYCYLQAVYLSLGSLWKRSLHFVSSLEYELAEDMRIIDRIHI